MRILDRYIAKNVLGAILVVQTLLLGLDLMLALVGELGDMNQHYQITHVLYYIMLTAPRRLYDLLPVAVMVGSLMGLGALAASNELAVIRAAGVSILRIIGSVMKPMLLIMLVSLALGEYVAPQAEQSAINYRIVTQSGNTRVNYENGVWHKEKNEFFYFSTILSDGRLLGVSRYVFDDQGHQTFSMYSPQGTYDSGRWRFDQAQFTYIGERQVEVKTEQNYYWETNLTPELLKMIIIGEENQSPSELWQYSQYLEERGLSANNYLMIFWRKTLMPLTLAALVLVAASFVFGPLRTVPAGTRVFSGVVVGLLVKYLQDILGPASVVYGFEPIMAILIPAFGCIAYGAILIRRAG
ncbi:lipopolysaccharide export system permease protein [Oceanospirillum multiglobuliferum]|uniref:LPS export ABC transporter permease LptG n=1 Tax=Oceanospirillum multiglobuliferum TaxID=64969 RepID=A0A1T4RCC5_9GAMM|nr:LPS export ABC transporter permease LptG [Oceanospirillum multiglobuliferum]OPX55185.1 LPS export ABC transporter permease LptG [Oceanospirillum multiglobuliferum]SKA13644.1 lipopolysaccharide export system permease protein [Oceanospirillum multiglobuliferum]